MYISPEKEDYKVLSEAIKDLSASVFRNRRKLCKWDRRCVKGRWLKLVYLGFLFADTVLGQIIDWLYGQIVGFLGDFFHADGKHGG